MKQRLVFIFRLYVTLLVVFALQKVVFVLCNMGYAGPLAAGDWLATLWHGLRLDSVTACYLLLLPLVVTLLSCCFAKFPLRKALVPYYAVVALVVTLIFVADVVLYHFWGAKLDAKDLIYAENPKDMLASVSVWACLFGGLVLLVLTAGMTLTLRKVTDPVLEGRTGWGSLLWLPVVGLLLLGLRGGLGASTANPSYAYFSSKTFLNHAALNPTFNMLHSLTKNENLAEQFQTFSDEELHELTEGDYFADATVTDTLLRTSRPNILLVVWEGGGSEMVMNDSVGPNITRLSHEGVYFSNCYANNFRTDRGLVSLLNGWPGLPTTSLMKMASMGRRLPALARTLHAEGYRTSMVYGGDADFTNMRGFLYETGFDSVFGVEAFPKTGHLSSWGAPDAYVLQRSEMHLVEPYFSTVLTLSSHEPWDVDMHRLHDERRNAFAYTDSCLGAFVEQLRQSPEWDNLLLIIVPDHGIPTSGKQTTADYHAAHIPMLWLGGTIREPRQIETMMNQSDIAATLLCQLGLRCDDFVFSRNIFSPLYVRPFAMHAYKNGMNLIDTTGVTTLDCIDMTERDNGTPTSPERFRKAKALLQLVYSVTGRL